MNSSKKTKSTTNLIDDIINYCSHNLISIDYLMVKYNRSENEITKLFLGLISSGFINDDFCKKLITKHVNEYESRHNIKNSALRKMYKEAIETRNKSFSSSR